MKLQLKEKGSLLAQRVLTGSNLSNALSVTNTPNICNTNITNPLEIYPTHWLAAE